MDFSAKQASYIAHSDAFLCLADGAVRSGKTHAALIRFAKYCLEGPKGDLVIAGRTHDTAYRNVIVPLLEMFPETGIVKYIHGMRVMHLFGRRCWVIGANNVEAEQKVRGMTIAGAYLNEVSLYPREVFEQVIARTVSIPNAQIFMDCNPDSPYHWLMEDFIEADLPPAYLKRWRFKLEDNPILPEENVTMLKALYGPGTLFYRRMIDGEWVMAEGAIYQQFDERVHVITDYPRKLTKVVVGADYGTSTVTSFIMLGHDADTKKWIALREYYWDAEKEGRQKTDAEFAMDLKRFIAGEGYPDPYGALHPSSIEIDPSAASFKLLCRRREVGRVRDADNEVLPGIRTVSTALTMGDLLIHGNCENLRKEMTVYAWDEKKQEKGEDAPLKEHDHAVDALRYGAVRALGKLRRGDLRLVKSEKVA